MRTSEHNERLDDLLVQRATEGLDAESLTELNQLLMQEQYDDRDQFDQTAAALLLASSLESEPLPDAMRARLLQQADLFSAAFSQTTATNIAERREVQPRANRIAWFAAAASVVLAVAGWWPRLSGIDESDLISQASPPTATLLQQRESLVAQAGAVQREWTSTQDPAAIGVSGDVVWHADAQTGYMRFRGLATNDPRTMQYQLWIFDATRGDKYPIDGGVFNIPANEDEVVVPILAKLPVREAAMFAVTMEKPGGVVVSEREHIVVLAKLAAG